MLFHECLKKLMQLHDKKATDICRGADLKKSYVSKMLSGELTPKTYNIVEKIMSALELTDKERIMLTNAYQMRKTSADGGMFWKSFSSLFMLEYPNTFSSDITDTEKSEYDNSELISGDKLLEAIRQLIKTSDKELTIFYTPLSEENSQKMFRIFAEISDESELRWLMPFDDSETGYKNFSIIADSLPLLCIKACSVRKFVCNMTTLTESIVFPFFVMSENELILFDKDICTGQYFTDKNLINIYRKKYVLNESSETVSFIDSFDDPQKAISFVGGLFLSIFDECCDYYTMANVPCMVFEMNKDIFTGIIADDMDKASISAGYYRLLTEISYKANSISDFFSIECMNDYLDAEEFYEIGKHFSKNLDKGFRQKMLVDFLGSLESDQGNKLEAFGMKIPGFSNSNPFFGVNMVSSGLLLIFYNFDEKTMVISVSDKNIVDTLINYIKELKNSGLIADKEETIKSIRESLVQRGILK